MSDFDDFDDELDGDYDPITDDLNRWLHDHGYDDLGQRIGERDDVQDSGNIRADVFPSLYDALEWAWDIGTIEFTTFFYEDGFWHYAVPDDSGETA